MYFGGARWEYNGRVSCPHEEDANLLDGVMHDIRCWGWRTAWFNLKIRLFKWDAVQYVDDES